MYKFSITVPWKYKGSPSTERLRGRQMQSAGGVGQQEANELLNYYNHVIQAPDVGEKTRLVDGLTVQLEKWGYIDYLYEAAINALLAEHEDPELRSRLKTEVYPEYRARVTNALHSEDFAGAIARAPQKIVPSISEKARKTPYASPALEQEAKDRGIAVKVRLELFTMLHNTLYQVIQEKASDLKLPDVWKRTWSHSTKSLSEVLGSGDGGGGGVSLGETLAEAPEKSNPAVMYENIAVPELAGTFAGIHTPEIMANISEKIKGVTDPNTIQATVLSEVQEYAKDRMGIIEDPEDEEYQQWSNEENIAAIAAHITNALARITAGAEAK